MKNDMIKSTTFKKTKLTQIVAFDSKFYLNDFKNTDLEKFREKLKDSYFSGSTPAFKPFSKIYDSEYAENNPDKIICIKSDISISKFISESEKALRIKDDKKKKEKFQSSQEIIQEYCNENIKILLSFDSCGVHSIRFDFDLDNIEPIELIKLLYSTCDLIEDYFFSCLKKDLEKSEIIKKDCLSKPMVYSIISCTKVYFNPIYKRREKLGISWKNKGYKTIKNNIMEEILKNDVAIHKNDIITITPQTVLMVFPDIKDDNYHDYVEERINATEIFWRQKFLLKKMHFKLNYLTTNIKQIREEKGLEYAINEIQDMQITIQSELEVYRNTIISVTHSYSMLFDTLNKVFKTKNQYNFVQEKLETCKSIYEGLNEERRNNLMENIQWIVVIIGLATIILSILVDVIYGPTVGLNQARNIIIIISLFLVVSTVLVIKVVKNKL